MTIGARNFYLGFWIYVLANCVMNQLALGQMLLIPDSGLDRIWTFNAFDGSLINNNFASGSMLQPINAIDSGNGTILVSDESSDSILEFSGTGAFLGVFADNTDGIDGPFGIHRHGSHVYVTSTLTNNILRFNSDGTGGVVWASGVGTPRDLVFRANDVLVSESGGDDILRFDLNGNLLGFFHNSDGVSGIDFPQQLQLDGTNILAAGFTAPFGLYQYDASGNQLNAYTNLITSPRGIYRLGNGNLLYAGGTRVMLYNTSTLAETTIVNQTGSSFRFIEFSAVPEPGALTAALVGVIACLGRRKRIPKV
jgi:hypothetical protein